MHAIRRTLLILVGVFVAGNASLAIAVPACPGDTTTLRADPHDFDFLLGDWNVHNRRLGQRLVHSNDWTEFEATDSFQLLPGNLGTEERYATEFWKGYAALGLHLHDPEHRLWVLYWADNRNAAGTMQTLAKGGFVDGVGVFCASDTFNGKPITVRILWKRVDRNHVRWEQAFSVDHGSSWETNWTMDFTRRHDL